MTQMPPAYTDISLTELFIEFYQEIVSYKASILDGYRSGKLSSMAEGVRPAEFIHYQLVQILQQQENTVRKLGTAALLQAYLSAQYAMVALADEIFLLNLEDISNGWWKPGDSDWWSRSLLEETMYGSTLAGDKFYEQIDQLLKRTKISPLEQELASVYLMVLKLGFKGKYFHQHSDEQPNKEWERYRDSLLSQCGSAGASQRIAKLFPEAYKNNLNPLKREQLAPISRWRNLTLVLFTLFIFASYVVWHLLTAKLSEFLG